MSKFSIFLALISIVSCSQGDQAVSIHVEKEHYVHNSDGSKTYLLGRKICDSETPHEANANDCFNSSTLYFYAIGYDFAGFDEKSLVIDKLIINDIDARKLSPFRSNTKLASFPYMNSDRSYANWRIEILEGYDTVDDELAISGHITAFKSNDLRELTSESFDINDFESYQLGNFIINGTQNNQIFTEFFNSESLTDIEIKSIEQFFQKQQELGHRTYQKEFLAGFEELGINIKDKDRLFDLVNVYFEISRNYIEGDALILKGHFSTLKNIEIFEGAEKIGGNFSSNIAGKPSSVINYRRYSLKKKPSSKIKIKISFWDNLEPVKLNFDF